eukprot:gene17665-24013_t
MSDSEPKPSKVLTKKMLGAHIIMVLVFPQLFIMGCIGLYVLTRAGSESVWAVTPVGIFFKWATSKNPATPESPHSKLRSLPCPLIGPLRVTQFVPYTSFLLGRRSGIMSVSPCLKGIPSFAAEKLKLSRGAAGTGVKLLTLAIVDQQGKLLLGEKKRGFGAGYVNGFGGKVEKGESIEAAAHRELVEEACITATSMDHFGSLTFVFED